MKKIPVAILLTILLWSCLDKNQLEQTKFSIDNKVKAEFLNEILSDTTDLKLLPDQNIMISDFNFLGVLPKSVYQNEKYITATELEFLSHQLKESDTIFIKEQIKNNKEFDLKELSDFGFRILNTNELFEKGVSIDSLSTIVLNKQTITDKLYNGYYILIDKPIFNKEMNRAYLSINDLHSGTQFVFTKEDGKWKKKNVGGWVE